MALARMPGASLTVTGTDRVFEAAGVFDLSPRNARKSSRPLEGPSDKELAPVNRRRAMPRR
jgi:hypothetical protein